jgi:hypothetical protein
MEKKDKINDLMFNSLEDDGFFKALELQYGNTVPLYHATDLLSYERIKEEGLVLKVSKKFLNLMLHSHPHYQVSLVGHSGACRLFFFKMFLNVKVV